MLKFRISFLVLVLLSSFALTAQDFHRCGVTLEDDAFIKLRLRKNKEAIANTIENRGGVLYVPVKFHLGANTDGTGRIDETALFRQLCRLNEDFAPANMVFYLTENNYLNHSGVFTAPYLGSSHNTMVAQKNLHGQNVLNIFTVLTADNPNDSSAGTVLAYYNPTGDYIVIRNDELTAANQNLSHEIGHFFSLSHPFVGWECGPYDPTRDGNPLTITSVPVDCGWGSLIEKVNGNCNTAADEICDTPPDYLFAFSSLNTGCGLNTQVLDIDGNEILTLANNYMSYFSRCSAYEWTSTQMDIMRTDFNSNERSYLRTGYVPNTDEVNPGEAFSMITPSHGSTTDAYNGVFLDWEVVSGADRYYVRVSGGSYFESKVTSESEMYLSDLEPDVLYFTLIIPYNESSTCHLGISSAFRTGTGSTSTDEIIAINTFNVFPNPTRGGQNVTLQLDMESPLNVSVQVSDMTGRIIIEKVNHDLSSGENVIRLDGGLLTSGMYHVILRHQDQLSVKNIIVE